MTSNMLLEDVLAILGRVGTVTLRKGTNDTSATPGHKADTQGWSCELQVAGYLVPWGHGGFGGSQLIISRRGSRRGLTALQAAQETLAELEEFLASPRAQECRECYLACYESDVARSRARDLDHRRPRHPGKPKPEARIQYGD